MQSFQCKVTVVGCGPIGMLSALKLASLYGRVVLIGLESSSNDLRTTVLLMPTIHILKEFGLWKKLQDHAAPLSIMRIIDGTNSLIRSPIVNFCAEEIGEGAFGYNIPNIVLNAAITKIVERCSKIYRMVTTVASYSYDSSMLEITLANKKKLRTCLLVAADGRVSTARDAAGIDVRQLHYPQTALVLIFSHQVPHYNISTEFHTIEGPFTQIPLLGNQSSLVWVVNPERAKQLLALNNEVLARKIEKRMHSMLGKISVETPVQAWEIAGLVPKTFAANRIILVGEAAHVLPPIGAQGFNLSIRDMLDLASAVTINIADPGAENVIRFYNRNRKLDVWTRIYFTHVLNNTFRLDCLPAQLGRSAVLATLQQCSLLRTLFMHEGMYPGEEGLRRFLFNATMRLSAKFM